MCGFSSRATVKNQFLQDGTARETYFATGKIPKPLICDSKGSRPLLAACTGRRFGICEDEPMFQAK